MAFVAFMASPLGRMLRVALGILLIAEGLFAVGGRGGVWMAAAGLVPLLAGTFNYCGIAPLLGAPFLGRNALARARSSRTA